LCCGKKGREEDGRELRKLDNGRKYIRDIGEPPLHAHRFLKGLAAVV